MHLAIPGTGILLARDIPQEGCIVQECTVTASQYTDSYDISFYVNSFLRNKFVHWILISLQNWGVLGPWWKYEALCKIEKKKLYNTSTEWMKICKEALLKPIHASITNWNYTMKTSNSKKFILYANQLSAKFPCRIKIYRSHIYIKIFGHQRSRSWTKFHEKELECVEKRCNCTYSF
jgi:hypothetical protein